MNKYELSERLRLLQAIAQKTLLHLNSEKYARLMGGNIAILDNDRLESVVEDYNFLIEDYREKHQPLGERIDADKIAAMTAFVIVKHRPIYPKYRRANHIVAPIMAELYAFRCIMTIMNIPQGRFCHSGRYLMRALQSLKNLREVDKMENFLKEKGVKTQIYQKSSETVISWMITYLAPFIDPKSIKSRHKD